MFVIKKYRHKPVYKKFATLKSDVPHRQKFFKFKKVKWKNILFKLKLKSRFKKRNCYYNFYDQNSYCVSKFSNYFSKNYKQNLMKKRGFFLFYGSLGKTYLKNVVRKSVKKSNSLSTKINSKIFFSTFLGRRLDVVLLKSNFALSARTARQLIIHKNVLVNGVVVKDNSFLVKTGDKIALKKKVHNLIRYSIIKSDMWPIPSKHLQISHRSLQIRIVDDVILSRPGDVQFDLNSIISSYKK